jgi:UDP-N-acetylmuramoyl-L-alanyl-D-glutamate--2,6-diaminopimelate ligase
MNLMDLIEGLDDGVVFGPQNPEITSIAYDSRKVRKGSIFVCIEGFVTDGHQYIQQVLDSDVSAIMIEKDLPKYYDKGVPFIRVLSTRKALALISAKFFANPAKKLYMLGVTGTKGKTTSTCMIHSMLESAGKSSSLIGTIHNIVGKNRVYSSRTTPESYDLQALLAECVSKKMEYCVMEVSSQGLWLDRVYGVDFGIAVYTNLYNDHIGPGEHRNMDEYRDAKSLLFERTQNAIINVDAKYANYMASKVRTDRGSKIYTYSIQKDSMIRAVNLKPVSVRHRIGTEFDLVSPWYNGKVFVGIPGEYNVYNALSAIACAGLLGIDFQSILTALSEISVKGRVQPIVTNRPFQVIVDYAHNAASLENLLKTLRDYTNGRLVTVFGCGGDRARSRRYEMGEVSGKLSDYTYITSDNPRTENPESIISDIEVAVKKSCGAYTKILDRTEAIKAAIFTAQKGDMIVIAGKGHETYQIFADKTIHYDDAEVAEGIIRELDKLQIENL